MEKITAKTGRIAFIGGGMMAEAILKGMLHADIAEPALITVSDPSAARREYLEETYKVNTVSDNVEAVKTAGFVILAVKPQVADAAITKEVAAAIPQTATVLSIMGSVNLAKLHALVPGHAVIRVMPNTPLAVGAGMTAIAPDANVGEDMLEAAKAIFGSCGEIEIISESAIEAITAISGCGPGYVFMMIDALADAGVKAGLPRAMAIKLAAQTFAGSGRMVLETGLHPAVLRDQVTSPGGTTIAGIYALENRGVRAAMYEAVMEWQCLNAAQNCRVNKWQTERKYCVILKRAAMKNWRPSCWTLPKTRAKAANTALRIFWTRTATTWRKLSPPTTIT